MTDLKTELARLSAEATQGEIWKPIVGWEGLYEVSDRGRVRTVARILVDKAGRMRSVEERIKKPRIGKQGYPLVDLNTLGRRRRTATVHRLVAEAFIPNPNGLEMVNHINHDKTCNLSTNLEWCSHLENVAHAQAAGRLTGRPRGYRSEKRKLTDEQVKRIRRMHRGGSSTRKMARQFNVGSTAIENIINGRTYADVC